MNRRSFLGYSAAIITCLSLPRLTLGETNPYPPNIARFITPDFEYTKTIKKIHDDHPATDVYEFWHSGINHRLHIGYLPNGHLAAQWWYRGALWEPRKGYLCRRTPPRYMQRFIQSYITEHRIT